jgi:glycosyltransferase involved in cell wall biosynthesis
MVFFHGWNKSYERKIDETRGYENHPIVRFKKSVAFIVLAKEFKAKLESWGFSQPIYLGKTVVDPILLEGYNWNGQKFRGIPEFSFLFLARVEKAKGILEAIDLFAGVQALNPTRKLTLRIGGDGTFLSEAKKYVSDKKISNVEFLGHVEGNDKRKVLETSHFFLFPSHGEGMPLSVLEALAFGLPCLVTPVGGLKDFFQDQKMGLLMNSHRINDSVGALHQMINNTDLLEGISAFNYDFARKNFLASNIAKELQALFLEVYRNGESKG